MKVSLMFPDRVFRRDDELSDQSATLIDDLGLNVVFSAMSQGDDFLLGVAREAVLSSLVDSNLIGYRQSVLRDCLAHREVVRDLYDIAVESRSRERNIYRSLSSHNPAAVLSGAIRALELQTELLGKLREIAERSMVEFSSEGFANFFGMITRELDDEYLGEVEDHLKKLRFSHGVLLSVELDHGNKGSNYILRQTQPNHWSLVDFLLGNGAESYSFRIPDRDVNGAQALAELRARGINKVANAVGQSADHILGYFAALRNELAFYVGCINLEEQFSSKGGGYCFPVPEPVDRMTITAEGLYDVSLCLTTSGNVVGNNIEADDAGLIMITGANQGGKSTCLRSLGLAQIMMQCGMFVPATSFGANMCSGIFTHFKREEDATMVSGKFVEELKRMSGIADQVSSGGVIFFNESFASTNEREGSEIARHVIRALHDSGVKVVFVTHLFDLAKTLYDQQPAGSLFLRAERKADEKRTFKIKKGAPLSTSYGNDLYAQIFGSVPAAETVGANRTP